jgi:hypothetical protein
MLSSLCFLPLLCCDVLCCAGRFGLRDYGIELNPTELEQVFLYFDSSRDGFIGIDEFLIGECPWDGMGWGGMGWNRGG